MRRLLVVSCAAAALLSAGPASAASAAGGGPASLSDVAARAAAASGASTRATSAAARKAARRCAGRRPTLLTFTRHGGSSGRLTWRRPRLPRRGRLRYRVLRDGAVVRQTTRRVMVVRVKPGRRHRFEVRVVQRGGGVSRCSARIVRDLRRLAPTRPRDLAVSKVSETGATLSWSPGRARAGRLVGHRVFRDGVPLRQVRGRTARVQLSPLRTYVFAVAAVDSTGGVSPQSAPVKVNTGHDPPTAPGPASFANVGADAVDVSWAPSTAHGGRISGYRVLRDGRMLRQVPEPHTRITGLAPAHSYAITVVAVDSLGYLSEPSPARSVTTGLPDQTAGGVHAFLLASTGRSFADLREHYHQIGTVHPTYYECNADGSLGGRDDPFVTGWARLRGIAVMPRIDCQSTSRLHLILTDAGVRGAMLGTLSALVRERGYDGLNVDFEAGLATDRAALTSFVTDLANLLHGQGKRLSVAVSATTRDTTTGRAGFYDYRALGSVADTVFVMNWGKHWSTSGPGAIADLPWATQVADYVATMPNKHRYVLGAGLYGMDWPAGGGPSHPATPLEWEDIQNLIAAVGATPVFDPVAGAPHFSYVDAQGVGHDVWYTDARSLAAHIRLARDRGLGIGFWRLGREDPAIWSDPLLAPGVGWP